MSDTVDTRVVEAKFDAEDFEKGVDKTIKKLDELKKSLNMKDSGKSVTEFSKITSEATEKANSSLEKLTNRLTTFTGQLKNQLISGLAGEVSNAFLKMERSITGFFNTITSGSMRSGMDRYTEILTAVRTMVAAGKDESAAYKEIKLLGEYADQTSYSLSTMAGTMSKMVAAGMKLEDARKSVEGLANMAAAAGVNIYDANRAFLNFSQAYSSGAMRIQDWMSFESLNMSTEKTMKLFMEAGVQAGTLVKTTKKNAKGIEETVYKTTNKVNKKISSGKEVAIKGFRDSLKYGWADQLTQQYATGLLSFYDEYGGDVEKLTEEQLEQAKAMYGAAKEARSFADVMGTLRDVLATGWSNTFEQLFGKLERAKEFFTSLADSNFLNIFYSLSEYRNKILELWNINTSAGGTGSELFLEGILNVDEAIGIVSEKIAALMPSATNLSDMLYEKTLDFREGTKNLIDWLNKAADGDTKTRAERIADILSVVGTAFSVMAKIVGTAVKSINIVVTAFSPIIDAVIVTLSKFAESLAETNKNTTVFDDISDSVNNIMIAAKPLLDILPPIIEFLGIIGQFFLDTAISTMTMNVQLFSDALGFMIELFGGKSSQELRDPNKSVIGRIKQSVLDMKAAIDMTLGAAREFFGNLITDLRVLLGIGETAEGEEGGFFTNVSNFFKTNKFIEDAKAWIDQAVIDVGKFIKDIPNRLTGYAFNVWDFFHGLFYQKEDLSSVNGNGHGAISAEITDAEVATPLKQWLDDVVVKVKEFVASIPERIAAVAHDVGTVVGKTIENIIAFFLGDKASEFELNKVDATGDIHTQTITVRDTLNSGFNSMLTEAKNFVKDIPNKVKNGIKTVGTVLQNFWNGLFYENRRVVSIDKDGKKYWKDVQIRKPLKKFIDKVVREATDFIKKIPEYIRTGIRSAGTVVGNLVAALFGKKDDGEATGKDIEDAVMKPFANFSFSGVLGKIKEIGTSLGNWVISIFTGTDDIEKNQEIFAKTVAAGITWIKDKAVIAWNAITEWFINLPHAIAEFFSGERTEAEINNSAKEMGPVEKAVRDFANTIGEFIKSVPDKLLTFFDNAIVEIGKLWNRLYTALSGEGEEVKEEKEVPHNYKNLYEQFDDVAPLDKDIDVSKWKTFTEHLGRTIANLFAQIPTFIAQGIDLAIQGIDWAINGITSWFGMGGAEKKIADESKKTGEQIMTDIGESTKYGADKETGGALLIALGNIGQSISKLITETIPGFLTTGWNFVRDNAGKWWEALTGIFSGYDTSQLKEKIDGIGEAIEGFIHNIPTYIRNGVDWVSDRLHGRQNRKDFVADQILDQMIGVKTDQLPVYMKNRLTLELDQGAKNSSEAIKESKIWDFTTGTWSTKLTETANNMKSETDDGGIWGIVKSIGESLMYAFSQIGPYIVKGFNTALEWVNKGITWMTNFLTNRNKDKPLMEDLQTAIAGEDGENKELAESMYTLGNTIKGTMVDTLPAFIQAGAEEVAAQAPNILEMLFSGLIPSAKADDAYKEVTEEITKNCEEAGKELNESVDKVMKENTKPFYSYTQRVGLYKAGKISSPWADITDEVMPSGEDIKDAEEKAEGATTMLDILTNIIDGAGKLMTTDVGRVAIGLGAVGFVLFQIKDILSFTDEVESFGWTAKWEAIKLAIAGIVGVVGYIMVLTATQNEDQLQKTWDSFDKIVGFVKGIVGALTGLAALKLGSAGLEALGSFFGMKGDKFKAKAGGAAGGWFSNLSSSILGTIGGYATLTVGGQVLTNSLETWGTGISDTLYSLANGVTSFIELLMPGFNAIIEADTKIGQATEFVGKLKDFVEKLIEGTDFSDIGTLEEGTKKHEFSKGDDIINKRLSTIYNIGQMLTSLTTSVNAMPDLETAKARFAEVTKLMDTQEFKDLLNKASDIVYDIRGITDFEDVGIGMQMLGNTLGIFTGALSSISPENVGVFEKVLSSFDRIVAAYTSSDWSRYGIENLWKGDKSISNFGLQIQQFGGYISRFFDSVKKINVSGDSQVKLLKDKIDMVVTITQGFAAAAKDINGTDNGLGLSDMASRMTGIGSQIASFINALHTGLESDISLDDLAIAKSASEIFRDLAGTIHDLYVVGANIPEATLTIGEMIKGIVGNPEDPGMDSLVQQINSLVLDDLNLTPTITPVIDMSNVDAAFNSRFGPNWQFSFDPGTVSAQMANPANANGSTVINAQTDISAITDKLATTNAYLASILEKNPIYSVYMDSGVLVGQMGPAMYNYISSQLVREGRR